MINSDKYERTVSLLCPTCGGTEFESQAANEEVAQFKCLSCGLTTTKSELIAANGENIDAQLDEIKTEVLNDMTKSIASAFKGNKFNKLR